MQHILSKYLIAETSPKEPTCHPIYHEAKDNQSLSKRKVKGVV